MRIVHLSYAQIKTFDDPVAWLEKINFYTGVIEQMALMNEVTSIHYLNHEGTIARGGVKYHFIRHNRWKYLLPLSLHANLRKFKPDVVIVHGLIFSWQIFLLAIQTRPSARIFVQHHAEKPLLFPKSILQKINDRFICGYFFASIDLALSWIKRRQIYSLSKITEVMEASSVFSVMDKSEALKVTNAKGHPVYLWVGRLEKNKDPITLVKAFVKFIDKVPGAKLYVIFQQDDLLEEIRYSIGYYSENIILVGKVLHNQLGHWFNSADYIISTSHYEGSGIAVCEAMSCGCIPILTDIPSFQMMTANGKCGLLFSPGDVEDLFLALLKSTVLDVITQRGRVLRQFRENLSFEAIAGKMMATIKQAH